MRQGGDTRVSDMGTIASEFRVARFDSIFRKRLLEEKKALTKGCDGWGIVLQKREKGMRMFDSVPEKPGVKKVD